MLRISLSTPRTLTPRPGRGSTRHRETAPRPCEPVGLLAGHPRIQGKEFTLLVPACVGAPVRDEVDPRFEEIQAGEELGELRPRPHLHGGAVAAIDVHHRMPRF